MVNALPPLSNSPTGFVEPSDNNGQTSYDPNLNLHNQVFGWGEDAVFALKNVNRAIVEHWAELDQWMLGLRSSTVRKFEERIKPALESKEVTPLSVVKKTAAQAYLEALYTNLGITGSPLLQPQNQRT